MQHVFLLGLLLSSAALEAPAQTAAKPNSPVGKAASLRPTATPTPAATAAKPVVTYALQGQVLGPDGLPLPGAMILVRSSRQVHIANADGYFTFSSPRPVEAVEISLPGYEKASLSLHRAAAEAVTLQLLPGTRIKRTGRKAGQIVSVGS